MSSQPTPSGGIGFFGLLTVAFVVLKLTHVIAWSWAWVLSPVWLPAVVGFGGLALWFLLVAILARRK